MHIRNRRLQPRYIWELIPYFNGIADVVPNTPQQEIQESSISPSCRSDELAPLMVCGEYVLVKGKLNRSNNLERLDRGTMYMSKYLTENKNSEIIDKNVLLSGKCSSEVISGLFVMIHLDEAKLLQVFDNEKIEESTMLQTCTELKNIKTQEKGK